jgi:hypothetical protein
MLFKRLVGLSVGRTTSLSQHQLVATGSKDPEYIEWRRRFRNSSPTSNCRIFPPGNLAMLVSRKRRKGRLKFSVLSEAVGHGEIAELRAANPEVPECDTEVETC